MIGDGDRAEAPAAVHVDQVPHGNFSVAKIRVHVKIS
jgi:hypothetical protein